MRHKLILLPILAIMASCAARPVSAPSPAPWAPEGLRRHWAGQLNGKQASIHMFCGGNSVVTRLLTTDEEGNPLMISRYDTKSLVSYGVRGTRDGKAFYDVLSGQQVMASASQSEMEAEDRIRLLKKEREGKH